MYKEDSSVEDYRTDAVYVTNPGNCDNVLLKRPHNVIKVCVCEVEMLVRD